MTLEVCVDSLDSVINAAHGGADELELCSSIREGGLTPTAGLLRQARVALDRYTENTGRKKPKINALVRPRAGADFNYSEHEMETMLEDLHVLQFWLPDRFVFGCLTETGHIDERQNRRLIDACYPTPVTFHRAFDVSADDPMALEVIKKLGFDRLLTSGKYKSVAHHGAAEFIQCLLDDANGDIDIVPAGGLNAENAREFIQMGCRILHSTCKSPIGKGQPHPCLGFGVDDVYVTDVKKVQDLKKLLDEFENH